MVLHQPRTSTAEGGKHFNADENTANFDLTDRVRQKVRCSNPPCGAHSRAMDKLHEHVERTIHAHEEQWLSGQC